MSCKSALYTALQTPTAVAVDGVIPLGSLIRRYGCDISLNGNAVNLSGAGYYDVDASITVAPTAAGTVTATLVKDGVAIPGATASAAAAAGAQTAVAQGGRQAGHHRQHRQDDEVADYDHDRTIHFLTLP